MVLGADLQSDLRSWKMKTNYSSVQEEAVGGRQASDFSTTVQAKDYEVKSAKFWGKQNVTWEHYLVNSYPNVTEPALPSRFSHVRLCATP